MPDFSITQSFIVAAGSGDETEGIIPDNVREQPRNINVTGFIGGYQSNVGQWSGQKVWLVFHGWNGNYADFQEIASRVSSANPGDIVLSVDWTEASGGTGLVGRTPDVGAPANAGVFYAASWIGPVAEAIYLRLREWGISSGEDLNFIGHSLGSLMSSQIAGQFVDNGLRAVNSITALDPPSEINSAGGILTASDILGWVPGIVSVPQRYRNGYNLDLRRPDADQVPFRPREFNQVATFSRAFVGSRSIAGNRQFALWSNEPVLVDFGVQPMPAPTNGIGGIGREHGDVYRNFRRLIDPNARQLARGLFSFDDREDHQQFGLLQERDQNGRGGFRGFLASRFGGGNEAANRFAEPLFFLAPRVPVGDLGRDYTADEIAAINATTYVVYATTSNDVMRAIPAVSQESSDIALFNGRNLDTLKSQVNMASVIVGQSVLYYLGTGDDIAFAGNGNDVIFGDEGDDKLYGLNGNDLLNGGQGNDYVQGNVGNDILIGGRGEDILLGGASQDILYGDDFLQTSGSRDPNQAYDDIINAGEDNDKAYGGWGRDSIRGGTGDDTLFGGDDEDRLYGEEGLDNLVGDAGDDRLYGGDGDDQISGGVDHDHLDGGGGSDQLKGNDGNDFLTGAIGDDTLIGGTGIDRLYGGEGFDTLYGDDATPTAVMLDALYNDIIDGGAGIDQIQGGWGSDTIWGGTNNDTIYGDWQDGGASPPTNINFDDIIHGGNGRDTIQGGWGDDTIWGGDDTDILYGNDGDDEIHGGANTPVPVSPPVVIIGTGYGVGLPDEFELLDGGKGDDTLYGDSGNDRLYGREDDDTLYGGEGTDELWGNSGDDQLNGGEGNDKLYGGNNKDVLSGDSGDDELQGGAGNDKLYGRLGNDVLYGGVGNDELEGGSGNDWLSGVDAETPSGANEIDRLLGGGGQDTFILGDANTAFYLHPTIDSFDAGDLDYALIADFNAQKDKIQLNGKASDYFLAATTAGTGIYKGKSLDLVFLSDRSESFQSQATYEKQFAQELINRLQQQQLDVHYGVASFVDIPAYPFGLNQTIEIEIIPDEVVPGHTESMNGPAYYSYEVPGYTIPGYETRTIRETGDSYIYAQNLPLSNNPDQVTSTLEDMEFLTQADAPEDQLLALQSLAQDSSIGFRSNSSRIVVMMTDSPYHIAGDVSAAGVNLGGYDYPDITQLRSALQASNIAPIFVVTSNVLSNYRSLAHQLGFDDRIVFDLGTIANNPAQLTQQIAAASRDLVGVVQGNTGLNLNSSYFSYAG